MGSPGPISVAHISSEDLTHGSFVHYPAPMTTCIPNVLSENPDRVGSPRGTGRKRPFPRSGSSILSDSDGDASEDKSVVEWPRSNCPVTEQHSEEERTGSHMSPGVLNRSSKFRIVADEDKIMSNNLPIGTSRFENTNGLALDDSPDDVPFELDASEHQSHLDFGTEEISEFGVNGGKLTLWQFLLELLLSNKYRNLIRWTNKKGEFILLQAEAVAKLWGLYKDRNHRMNYDKLSRALRYYYEKNIIRKVHGHKFVYQFMGLRNLIKMCQDATNNAVPSRPLESIVDCGSPQAPETKPSTDWDLPTASVSRLDGSPPCVYAQNDLQESITCATSNVIQSNNSSSNSVVDGHGSVFYSQNGFTPAKSSTRGANHLTLDGLIERWSMGARAEKLHKSSPVASSTIQEHRSPRSDEAAMLKDRLSGTPESTDLQFPNSVDPNFDSDPSTNQRANDFSSLLCSLASFMSAGNWIPRLTEQKPDSQAPFVLPPSPVADLVSKPLSSNFLLNPIPGPLWMTQLMNPGREAFRSIEPVSDNDRTRAKLRQPDPHPTSTGPTHQAPKSPIPANASTALNRFLQSQDHVFDESSIFVQPATQSEQIIPETRSDFGTRVISPDCHCSCHTVRLTKSTDWSLRNPTSATDSLSISTNTSAKASNNLFARDVDKESANSALTEKDSLTLAPDLSVNPVRETSPTQLHHQRHAINMQRLGEQLSRISRSHSQLMSNSIQPGSANTALPLGTNYIPTGVSSAPLSTSRVHSIGRNDVVGHDPNKPGTLFESGNDTSPQIPSSLSSSSSSSIPSGCLRNDEPCVWMPVPVTMLTSWIKLLSGMTTANPGLGMTATAPADCASHNDSHNVRSSEAELSNASSMLHAQLYPMPTSMETFASMKTEPRDSDHFTGV